MDKNLLVRAELAYNVSIHTIINNITKHITYCNYTLDDIEDLLNNKIDDGYEEINMALGYSGLESLSYAMKQTCNRQYINKIKWTLLYLYDEEMKNLDKYINNYKSEEFSKLPEEIVIAIKEQVHTDIKLCLNNTLDNLYKDYKQRYHQE